MSSTLVKGLPRRTVAILFGLMALIALGCLGCIPAAYTVTADTEIGSNVSDYDYLSDYGEWMHIPPYGMVWHPSVVAEWGPFSYGHWSWTNDGWAWISYEPFGWLVYHYGYWDYSPAIGWFWVPGNVWSPARVEWYTFGDYCGWAPLPPPGVSWPDPWQPFSINVWIVVDVDHFTDDNVVHGRITRPITRREAPPLRHPPTIRQVEDATKRPIAPVKIVRRPVNVQREVMKAPPRSGRAGDVKLRRMVLPEPDMNKVKEYQPAVERDVLVPKKEAAPEKRQIERQPAQQEEQQQQREKKQEETRQKKRQT